MQNTTTGQDRTATGCVVWAYEYACQRYLATKTMWRATAAGVQSFWRATDDAGEQIERLIMSPLWGRLQPARSTEVDPINNQGNPASHGTRAPSHSRSPSCSCVSLRSSWPNYVETCSCRCAPMLGAPRKRRLRRGALMNQPIRCFRLRSYRCSSRQR